MKETVNFSLCETDLGKFDGKWSELGSFLKGHGLSGVELFIDQRPLPTIPKELITGVHLPYWMGHHRAWVDDSVFCREMGELEILLVYGGCSKEDVICNFRQTLMNAVSLEAAYGVFHVAYSEPSYIFAREFECTDIDVFRTTADFLNKSVADFPNGEPPVRLFFENLWWPGLTLLDPSAVLQFTEMLEFDNWAFVLDTGHLIAAVGNCFQEDRGVDAVLNVLSRHNDAIIDRIEGIHFHCGMSGGYAHNKFEGCYDPDDENMFFEAMKYVNIIDPHQPFTSERCREIVDFVSPDFLTHEFLSWDLAELDHKIRTQRHALYKKVDNNLDEAHKQELEVHSEVP